ncbi:MAG: hypothetical protein ONB16_03830 [candidate division KSB1 bacterium]|nr:hypothetical protein [candidate division KSB1 bacterium]MDZ7318041.1 hypothetical protein [candidate division KSB1 bacterium]MDZ7341321.1 hypothetical protein [candidate division KSB1 bacterium]
MTTLQGRSKIVWVIFLSSLGVLIGCAARLPTAKYELLQESASSLLNNTTDTYFRIEKLQHRFAVTTAPDAAITRQSFKPLIGGQSFDLTPELRFREDALEVLVDYLQVLRALATKDYLKNVDKATLQLGGSLRNLLESSQLLPESQETKVTGIFAALMNQMAREIVKQETRTALKQAMDLAQDDIDKLVALIVQSNLKIKLTIGVMLTPLINHANEVRPQAGTLPRLPFDLEFAAIIAEADEIEASLDAVNRGLEKIPAAHKEIRRHLDKIQSAFDSLQELAREARRAQKFYRNLKD